MIGESPSAWMWLIGLGALHGVNPAMGWLFAVALGLQERSARAVWRALLPLAFGHALAIGLAILLASLVGLVMPLAYLKWLVAAALLTFAVRQLVRNGHPRWGGMRVGRRDLAIWSLLMASAHGAGLMVLPVLLHDQTMAVHAAQTGPIDTAGAGDAGAGHDQHHRMPVAMGDTSDHAAHLAAVADGGPSRGRLAEVLAALVHTLGYLLVTGFMAFIVYAWAGLRLLRSAWINLDLIWAGALIVTGLLTPFL